MPTPLSIAWIALPWLLSILQLAGCLPRQLRIGALYEPEFEGQWRAVEWAVQEVNLNPTILGSSLILVDSDTVQAQDSFTAHRKVCRMTNTGIAAMFGPMSSLTAAHVQSICQTFEIPHLQWRWDPRDNRDYFSISLYPHYRTLSKAYREAIRHWKWTRFTILYETNEGLTRVQEVLNATDGKAAGSPRVSIRKLEPHTDYVMLLKKLKDDGEFRFIIDCDIKTVDKFLHAGLQVKMISDLFHYFFTTLDLGLLDLEEYSHGGANITAYRLIDPERSTVVSKRYSWMERSRRGEKSPLMEYSNVATETALAYDAYMLFARALHSLSEAQDVDTAKLPCDKVITWDHGNSLLNYMKSIKFEGLSGIVKYEHGERYDFDLDLLFLKQGGLMKVGKWNRQHGLNISYEKREELKLDTSNRHYIVATYLTAPYIVENKTSASGYSGFCVELLDMIAKARNFTYEIHLEETVGKPQANGSWNGVMRALIDRRAQIGVGDLTINLDRETVVDFTEPFLTLGITILYKKPNPKSLNLFSFLSPLSLDVWVYMIAAYLCVSFMLFVIARFSPYEWCNPHPCNPDTDEVENQFTVMNSLWFTIGSLMQQGCEIAPRALSTRLVAGIWWFFTLIMISSYTANLAAFLTVERMEADITGAEDLAKQTTIKYGTFAGGATMEFFKTSDMAPYDRMWNFMNMNTSGESNFVKNIDMAVARIKKGNFAYITESTTVEYVIQRNCDLMQIGGLLDSKGYGFATPPGSPLREILTKEILRMKEEQEIEKLRKKWWEKMLLDGESCNNEEGKVAGKATELGVENVGGVFVVLMGGVGIGFVVSVCEFVWKAKKNAKKDKQTLCSEMSEEFRFAVQCFGSKKSNKTNEEDIVTDNGLQFMPLTGYNAGQNSYRKEVYA